MSKEEDKEEYNKCKSDPYYFYVTYCTVDGKKPDISREQFDSIIELLPTAHIKPRILRNRLNRRIPPCSGHAFENNDNDR